MNQKPLQSQHIFYRETNITIVKQKISCHYEFDLVSLSLFSFAKAKRASLNFHRPYLMRMCKLAGKFEGKWDKTSRRDEHLSFFLSFLWPSLDVLACCEEPPFSLFLGYLVPLQRKGKEAGPTFCKEIFTWPTFSSFCSGKDKHQFASLSFKNFACVECTFAICIIETFPQYRLQKDPTEADRYIATSWQQGMLLKVYLGRRV